MDSFKRQVMQIIVDESPARVIVGELAGLLLLKAAKLDKEGIDIRMGEEIRTYASKLMEISERGVYDNNG